MDIEPVFTKDTKSVDSKGKQYKNIILWSVCGIFLLVVLIVVFIFIWYRSQLEPVDPNSSDTSQIIISDGDNISDVSMDLEKKGLIRNSLALQIYYKTSKTSKIHAGVYTISKQQSPAQILSKISKGEVDNFQITFKPGENIFDAKKVLRKAGYSDKDIEKAFSRQYSKYSMMSGRPAGSSIEGFILGETYGITKQYTVENILDEPFSLLQNYINKEGFESAFKRHGLSLYEGITLASIIQREVSNPDDMLLVSSVFHNRLKKGMPLGSDVTAAYGAKTLGRTVSVVEAISIDTPYNTRIHKGLPPTPIASPGLRALRAAANPASSDYMYFVAGDDGKTYFAVTNQEHEKNTKNHCDKLCKL